jgi:preprotein translocase subunit SecG
MYGFFLTILILNGIFLTVVILLQAGKGGGLAAMGGGVTATEGVLGGRQATTFLTRATWTSGTIFMVLSLILSIMSSRAAPPGSILQEDLQPVPTQPSPVLPGTEEPPGGAGAAEGDESGVVPPPQ